MIPGCYDWAPQYAGDTALFLEFKLTEDGSPMDLTGAEINMQVRNTQSNAVVLDLTSQSSAGIEITDATGGAFRVGGYATPDQPGLHAYDIEVTFSGGEVRTFIKGFYPIHNQVTT